MPNTVFYAFFVRDVGGWWTIKGITDDKEVTIRTLETWKRSKGCEHIEVLELPGGRLVYEWTAEPHPAKE
jgi:hypothetical protein